MIPESMYKTFPGEFCLTACIRNILRSRGYEIEEEDLVCGRNFLTLECATDISSTSVDIISAINDMGERHEIFLEKITENLNGNFIKEMFDDNQIIILHINCQALKYSTLFSNTTSRQNKHYVNILRYKDQQYYVSDAYIPSRPVTSYEGWMNIHEEMITNYNAYIVKTVEQIPITRQEVYMSVTESIRNSKSSNYIVFNKFIENIYRLEEKSSVEERKIILQDMAVEIGIGGAKVSRMFLAKLLRKYRVCSNEKEICKRLWEIVEKYSILRMYLLKAAFGYRVDDIENAILTIKQIRDEEQEVFDCMYFY